MTTRKLERIIPSIPTSDGAGVKLRRSLGSSQAARLDPFLMLDDFSSDDPDDYIAGFPSHPHRGFETVTYMLDGHMLHEDHLGNKGHLKSGGVQWMTAGRGIIHSEMPQQEEGRMRGFQLWINLPAAEKMKPAHYKDLQAADIPVVNISNGSQVKVIAGDFIWNDVTTSGAIQGASTEPLYFDVWLEPNDSFRYAIPESHNAFLYCYEGNINVGSKENGARLENHTAGVLSDGEYIEVFTNEVPARFVLLAGKPLKETVVQYGPFVMNTRAEIEQAIHDYQSGLF